MSKIKGKKLTSTHRKILSHNGYKNTDDFRYLKTVAKGSDGGRAAKNGDNITELHFVNINSGEIVIIST